MKFKSLLIPVLTVVFAFVALAGTVRASVSVQFFYDSLAPYGDWVEVGDYGLCWRPAGVGEDWSPYSDGYWTYTDAGWTWVSYEEFGGIVYHYGRWVMVEDEGWCWVPDYDWGPAWVSWRSSDSYVGWAPLPPEARWRNDVGFSTWVDTTYDIGPGHYSFCHTRDFGEPFLRPVIVNRHENVTIIQTTINVTNITHYDREDWRDRREHGVGGLVFCGGPSFVAVNRFANRPIPALKLVRRREFDDRDRDHGDRFNAKVRGNQLAVFAPTMVRPVAPVADIRPSKVIPAGRVTKGWAGLKNPDLEREVRSKIKAETHNLKPEAAPARPVQKADLQVLPVKADPKAAMPTRTAREPGAPGRGPAAPPVAITAPKAPGSGSKRENERDVRDQDGPRKPVATVPVPGNAPGPVPPQPSVRPQISEQPREILNPRSPEDVRKQTPASPVRENAPVVTQPPARLPQISERPARVEKPPVPVAVGAAQPTERPQPPTSSPIRKVEPRVVQPSSGAQPVEAPARTTLKRQLSPQDQPDNRAAESAARERAAAAADEAANRKREIEGQRQQQQMQIEAARQKAAADAARDQKAEAKRRQDEDAARARQQEMHRQQQAAEAARVQQQRAEVYRQQSQEAARQQQAATAAKQQAAEAARAQQQAAAARQQQLEAARAQQAASAARAQQAQQIREQQIEAARRQQAAEAARSQPARAPVARPSAPAPPPQAPSGRGGQRQPTPEEIEAMKKAREKGR